ncbi:MAG: HAD family phosphatase [Candidatus Micrarchaeota archaeon]
MIKGVLFDFDGVIVRSEPLHRETFLELLSPYGITVSEERWYREFAGTGSRHIFEVLIRENGLGLDVGGLVERRKRIYEERVRSGRLEEMPGIKGFLGALKSRGIKTAIVSGSHRTNVQAALDTLGIGPFELIVSGDDVLERKPDPGPFLHAAKSLGIKPAECLAFEDSVSGCVAVRRAGMRLIIVDSPATRHAGRSDLVIKDFSPDECERISKVIG